ncbi:hypothetical protein DMN91_008288 [Ooceraea biroi]|uniref:Uncharacterized protein n=1 Tax=Ooceraea biroi TaxID=2015173 RepID=A0A026X2B2_OOCBI|nr:uncharacterized protein LOC105279809 [Ooceraea biroi]EZA62116.1 hypothetical protein X777_05443 [Ooceraea biroi]RLU19731.1 hypothetical protein DMN91_008288 [Ooceraea biroi]
MRLQGYSNTYLLMFLLCIFAMTCVQGANSDSTGQVTSEDVQHDIEQVITCANNTKSLGILVSQAGLLYKNAVIVLPIPIRLQQQRFIRNILNFIAYIVNAIMPFSQMSDIFSNLIIPLLEIHSLTH